MPEEIGMVLSELLSQIDPAWQADYVRFVDTGEASDDLLAYLDAHENVRQLIEFVFADPDETKTEAAAHVSSERTTPPHFVRPITNEA